jgi:hypothetical protein
VHPDTQFIVHPQVQNATLTRSLSLAPTFVVTDPHFSRDHPHSSHREPRLGDYHTRTFVTENGLETRYITEHDYNDTIAVWPIIPRRRHTNLPSSSTTHHETTSNQEHPYRPHNCSTPPQTHNHSTDAADLQAFEQSGRGETCVCNDLKFILGGFDRVLTAIVDLCELQRGELREILDLEEEEVVGGEGGMDGDGEVEEELGHERRQVVS